MSVIPGTRFDWRREALGGPSVDWDHFRTAADFATLRFTAAGDLKWFQFHLEAKAQREFVLSKIRRDLL
jgi:hypothetical protein